MIERRQDLGFALEARHALGILREAGGQHLDGHVAPELGIGGAIHLAHAALAELGGDAVMRDGLLRGSRNPPLQLVEEVEQHGDVDRVFRARQRSGSANTAKCLPSGARSRFEVPV